MMESKLIWNARARYVVCGDKSLNVKGPQVSRLMTLLGAHPGKLVELRRLDPDRTGWVTHAEPRLRKALVKTFGSDALLVKFREEGLRWDGLVTQDAYTAPLFFADENGKIANVARAIRHARKNGFVVEFDGRSANGRRVVLLVRETGQFVILAENETGIAAVPFAGVAAAVA